MSTHERSKPPYSYSTGVLAEPFSHMYPRCHDRSELREVRKAFEKTTLPLSRKFVINTFLDCLQVAPTTHINAVSAFLFRNGGNADPVEIVLHEWVGLTNPEGARRLFDAANERDMLDLKRALSDAELAREYEGDGFMMQQPESILRQIAERELLRTKIRERATPTHPTMRK